MEKAYGKMDKAISSRKPTDYRNAGFGNKMMVFSTTSRCQDAWNRIATSQQGEKMMSQGATKPSSNLQVNR